MPVNPLHWKILNIREFYHDFLNSDLQARKTDYHMSYPTTQTRNSNSSIGQIYSWRAICARTLVTFCHANRFFPINGLDWRGWEERKDRMTLLGMCVPATPGWTATPNALEG